MMMVMMKRVQKIVVKALFRGLNLWIAMDSPCWIRSTFSNAELKTEGKIALQQQIEGMHFVCGTLLFQEEEQPLGSIIAQRLALNCDAMLEKAYYNPSTGRKNFQTPLICIHCCGSGSNLHSHGELHTAGLTGGKECYPICRTCVIAGKKPVARTGVKKRNSQANKEDNERNQRLRTALAS
jgi:hypothetical protein